MTEPLVIVIGILLLLLIVGGPVIFAIGAAGLSYFIVKPGMWGLVPVYAHKFFTGMDEFVWLCIPLFIIAGDVMSSIGMTERLVRFAQLLVGRFKGGLAYVNVVGSMLFGGVSGSALADISALGPIEIDMMKRDGYTPEFSTALTVSSAIMGPIIPPSIPLIIFASLTNVSVGALFLAGIIPGIMIGLGQITVIKLMVSRRHYPPNVIKGLNWSIALRITLEAGYALMMPLIILGGIISGVFTATEAAAVAVGYAVLVGVLAYRNLTLREFWRILDRAARTSASIYLIIGVATIISWVLASERVPDLIVQFINHYQFETWQLLLLANIFFLFNGLWISDAVQLLLFAPLLTPIFVKMGVNPIHFGVMMVVNVMISLITPPYGLALYLGAIVGNVKLGAIVRNSFPFLVSSLVVLAVVTYFPDVVLWIPSMFGFVH